MLTRDRFRGSGVPIRLFVWGEPEVVTSYVDVVEPVVVSRFVTAVVTRVVSVPSSAAWRNASEGVGEYSGASGNTQSSSTSAGGQGSSSLSSSSSGVSLVDELGRVKKKLLWALATLQVMAPYISSGEYNSVKSTIERLLGKISGWYAYLSNSGEMGAGVSLDDDKLLRIVNDIAVAEAFIDTFSGWWKKVSGKVLGSYVSGTTVNAPGMDLLTSPSVGGDVLSKWAKITDAIEKGEITSADQILRELSLPAGTHVMWDVQNAINLSSWVFAPQKIGEVLANELMRLANNTKDANLKSIYKGLAHALMAGGIAATGPYLSVVESAVPGASGPLIFLGLTQALQQLNQYANDPIYSSEINNFLNAVKSGDPDAVATLLSIAGGMALAGVLAVKFGNVKVGNESVGAKIREAMRSRLESLASKLRARGYGKLAQLVEDIAKKYSTSVGSGRTFRDVEGVDFDVRVNKDGSLTIYSKEYGSLRVDSVIADSVKDISERLVAASVDKGLRGADIYAVLKEVVELGKKNPEAVKLLDEILSKVSGKPSLKWVEETLRSIKDYVGGDPSKISALEVYLRLSKGKLGPETITKVLGKINNEVVASEIRQMLQKGLDEDAYAFISWLAKANPSDESVARVVKFYRITGLKPTEVDPTQVLHITRELGGNLGKLMREVEEAISNARVSGADALVPALRKIVAEYGADPDLLGFLKQVLAKQGFVFEDEVRGMSGLVGEGVKVIPIKFTDLFSGKTMGITIRYSSKDGVIMIDFGKGTGFETRAVGTARIDWSAVKNALKVMEKGGAGGSGYVVSREFKLSDDALEWLTKALQDLGKNVGRGQERGGIKFTGTVISPTDAQRIVEFLERNGYKGSLIDELKALANSGKGKYLLIDPTHKTAKLVVLRQFSPKVGNYVIRRVTRIDLTEYGIPASVVREDVAKLLYLTKKYMLNGYTFGEALKKAMGDLLAQAEKETHALSGGGSGFGGGELKLMQARIQVLQRIADELSKNNADVTPNVAIADTGNSILIGFLAPTSSTSTASEAASEQGKGSVNAVNTGEGTQAAVQKNVSEGVGEYRAAEQAKTLNENMPAEKLLQEIRENFKGSVSVSDISAELGISEEEVMNDLEELVSQGKLRRVSVDVSVPVTVEVTREVTVPVNVVEHVGESVVKELRAVEVTKEIPIYKDVTVEKVVPINVVEYVGESVTKPLRVVNVEVEVPVWRDVTKEVEVPVGEVKYVGVTINKPLRVVEVTKEIPIYVDVVKEVTVPVGGVEYVGETVEGKVVEVPIVKTVTIEVPYYEVVDIPINTNPKPGNPPPSKPTTTPVPPMTLPPIGSGGYGGVPLGAFRPPKRRKQEEEVVI